MCNARVRVKLAKSFVLFFVSAGASACNGPLPPVYHGSLGNRASGILIFFWATGMVTDCSGRLRGMLMRLLETEGGFREIGGGDWKAFLEVVGGMKG